MNTNGSVSQENQETILTAIITIGGLQKKASLRIALVSLM
jgi:hypothetical protein